MPEAVATPYPNRAPAKALSPGVPNPAMDIVAGAASLDITPPGSVQLCGYPHVLRRSTGVHDPLRAAAVFLRNDHHAVLLGSLDLLMLNCTFARRLRQRVAGALGVGEAGVLISCTHTHSGPSTLEYLPWQGDPALPAPDPAYLNYVEDQLVAAALAAQTSAQPAELAWTSADASGVGGNRHAPDGPTDPEAGVLAVRVAGRLRALALSYGVHPTVLHEDSTLVSADFPHFTRSHLEATLGHGLVVLYQTGPAGNQSPRRFVTSQSFAEAERLGRKLAAAVLAALPRLSFWCAGALAGQIESVELPRRRFPSPVEAERLLAGERSRLERLRLAAAPRAELRTAQVAVFGAESLLGLTRAAQRGEIDRRLAQDQPTEVQAVRIGPAALVGFPGEIFTEYGLQLKAVAPIRTFPVAYANGELQGYIVTPEAAAAGGYEAASRVFEPEAGALLVDAARSALSALARPSAGESR